MALRLKRAIRVTENIILPNGERIVVALDVEAKFHALNAARNEATRLAQIYVNDVENEEKRRAFYAAFAHFVEIILGPENYKKALAAYDGYAEELCNQLDEWASDTVCAKMAEASKAVVEKRIRTAKRMQKLAK